MKTVELAEKYAEYIVGMRRYFHAHPETSRNEVNTGIRVREELEKMGIPFERKADNGAVATIGGKKPGKCILLRADMDALTVQEETGFDFASVEDGKMHACGHDGHMAMLLGCAKILKEMEDEICGTVKLCFQPAEEVAWGARAMVEEGAMEGVDACFAIHLWADVDAGKAAIQPGPFMAGADMFEIKIHGKGGHGSAPQQGIDALTTASAVVNGLQTIVSREIDPQDPGVLTIGTLNAGTRWNVLPEYATMSGTTRFYSEDLYNRFPEMMERVMKLTCEAHRAEGELIYTRIVYPTINDENIAKLAQGAIYKVFGEDGLQDFGKVTGGEDFSEIMKCAPGAVCFVGVRNPEIDGVYPNHHGKFKIDEPSMIKGAALYAQVAMDYLQ